MILLIINIKFSCTHFFSFQLFIVVNFRICWKTTYLLFLVLHEYILYLYFIFENKYIYDVLGEQLMLSRRSQNDSQTKNRIIDSK